MERVPTSEQWRALGARPVVTDAPLAYLDDLFYISGEIPRITAYEKGLANQASRVADDGPWRPDPLMMNERFRRRGRGNGRGAGRRGQAVKSFARQPHFDGQEAGGGA